MIAMNNEFIEIKLIVEFFQLINEFEKLVSFNFKINKYERNVKNIV